MFTAILTIALSIFFILYFGVLMLGNRVSHAIERIQAKEADEELAHINEMMSKYEQDKKKK
jgi:hypothetical protein